MISIQTNVDSLLALHNLNLDNEFQSGTIQQLTSGYRINKSGDDAAGLAVANGIESEISQLTQGINNANNGVSQLQIVDGGLSNISTILDRMQTLATESATSTFTGSRATLNQEYSGLIAEISRQASNINMAAGGSFNNALSVFLGGGGTVADSTVSVDLSGPQNAVDALSLGLTDTNVLGGGTGFAGNTVNLNSGTFLTGTTEAFKFNAVVNGTAVTATVTVNGGTNGISGPDVIAQLNQGLGSAQLGSIVASQNSAGQLTLQQHQCLQRAGSVDKHLHADYRLRNHHRQQRNQLSLYREYGQYAGHGSSHRNSHISGQWPDRQRHFNRCTGGHCDGNRKRHQRHNLAIWHLGRGQYSGDRH